MKPILLTAIAGCALRYLTLSSPLFGGNPQQLAGLALQNRLVVSSLRARTAKSIHAIGILVRKVLQGNAIADLPIERPAHFRLVANSVTAHALGLIMPTSILLSADEVIE
jgi:putative ABC transport system substrate-binding protein